MYATSRQIRNVSLFVSVAIFAVLLTLFSTIGMAQQVPFPVVVALAFAFGLSGLVLVVLTLRLQESRIQKMFFVLAGASAVLIPISVICTMCSMLSSSCGSERASGKAMARTSPFSLSWRLLWAQYCSWLEPRAASCF